MKRTIRPTDFRTFALELKELVDENMFIDELEIDIDVSQCLDIEEIFTVVAGIRKTKDEYESDREKYEHLLNSISDVNLIFSIQRIENRANKGYHYTVQVPNGETQFSKFFGDTFCDGGNLFKENIYKKARFIFDFTIFLPDNINENLAPAKLGNWAVGRLKAAEKYYCNDWDQLFKEVRNKDLLKKHSLYRTICLEGDQFGVLTGERVKVLCQDSRAYTKYIREHNQKIIIVNVSSADILDEELRVCLLFGLKGIKGNFDWEFKKYIPILHLKGKEYFRARTYLSAIIGDKFIALNQHEDALKKGGGFKTIRPLDNGDIGNLLPACYIDEKILDKFKQPIPLEAWGKIVSQDTITQETFLDSSQPLWPYYRICQRFLFEEFSGNRSDPYTELRNVAYGRTFKTKEGGDFYKDYASKVSFLALMVFAIYDAFYRSHLLQTAKDYYGTDKLEMADILLSKQALQQKARFDRYENSKGLFDIKNLLLEFDAKDKLELHPTVISEIIESVSISEGVLQLLENAVQHADGGLFSLRIFSRATKLKERGFRAPDNVTYLDSIYGDYYFKQYEKLNRHANFYLDLQISDLSEMSIPRKFYENHQREQDLSKETWDRFTTAYKAKPSKIDLNYFFEPDGDQRILRAAFYTDKPESLIHHYGLDIFRTIVENRMGIFAVSGYRMRYSNLPHYYDKTHEIEDIPQSLSHFSISDLGINIVEELQKSLIGKRKKIEDKVIGLSDVSGTHYRILLPLAHDSLGDSMQHGENPIVQQNNELISQYNSLVDLTDALENGVDKAVAEMAENVDGKKKDIDLEKRADVVITKVSETLRGKYSKQVCVYYINWENLKRQDEIQIGEREKIYELYFEEIIKGILLFALKSTRNKETTEDEAGKENEKVLFPIALVNMTEFQLLNAARIIATYYSKSKTTQYQPFQYVQIYLKSQKAGMEVIFAGNDLKDVKSNLIKSAMTNGIMFQEITTLLRMVESFSFNS